MIVFLFLHENICCGYSLEVPAKALLIGTHNICFCGIIRKIFTRAQLFKANDVVS